MPQANAAGPWRPAQTARPLHWWDQRGLERAEVELQRLFDAWSTAWGLAEVAVRCRAAAAPAGSQIHWFSFEVSGREVAWLSQSTDEARLLASLFPGATAFGPLARAVVNACFQDLRASVAKLLGAAATLVEGAPASTIMRAGSGALEAGISGVLQGSLLVTSEAAARWRIGSRSHAAPATRPLVPATAALATRPLALEVHLDGCELEVGAVQSLQVGDVVRLEHALERPASVRHAGAALCAAYLGRRQDRKAVELATGVLAQ